MTKTQFLIATKSRAGITVVKYVFFALFGIYTLFVIANLVYAQYTGELLPFSEYTTSGEKWHTTLTSFSLTLIGAYLVGFSPIFAWLQIKYLRKYLKLVKQDIEHFDDSDYYVETIVELKDDLEKTKGLTLDVRNLWELKKTYDRLLIKAILEDAAGGPLTKNMQMEKERLEKDLAECDQKKEINDKNFLAIMNETRKEIRGQMKKKELNAKDMEPFREMAQMIEELLARYNKAFKFSFSFKK